MRLRSRYYLPFGIIVSMMFVLVLVWTRSKPLPTSHFDPVVPTPVLRSYITKDIEYFQIPDVYYLHNRFYNKTQDTLCNNTLLCARHDDVNSCGSGAKTMKQWQKLLQSESFRNIPLFSSNEYFFPWELDYLKSPRLYDTNTLPDLSKSYVVYYKGSGNSNNPTTMSSSSSASGGGEVITLVNNVPGKFRAHLVDVLGRPRSKGGDEVRAWLTGDKGEGKEMLAVTAHVKDNRDGSYDVIATPKWAGTVQLHVAVPYPREYMRAVLNLRWVGETQYLYALYQQGKKREVTLCTSTPNVPGRPCICNMTKVNSLPFYCGKPLNSRFSCEDRPSMYRVPVQRFHDLTPAEEAMAKNGSRTAMAATIRNNLRITVKRTSADPALPPCHNASRRDTWTKTSPRGIWSRSKNRWTSLVCREPRITTERFQNCLKSRTVWMIGDSNLRRMVEMVPDVFGCPHDIFEKWPQHIQCKNTKYNISLYLRSHDYPVYFSKRWAPFVSEGSMAETLASIPSTGNHVIVIHHYLHFTSSHLNVLLQRLRALKNAISDLLSRNPNVLVLIRGPHISTVQHQYGHMFSGDAWGSRMRDIHVETFRDLHDKIVFLDAWDMSISLENSSYHPPYFVYRALWQTILSYTCN